MLALYALLCVAGHVLAVTVLRKNRRAGAIALAATVVVSIPAYWAIVNFGVVFARLLTARDL